MARGKYGGVGYDTDTDYEKEIQRAVEMGDYGYAATLEKMRNAKIQGEGLNYGLTDRYSQYAKQKGPSSAVVKSEGSAVPTVKSGGTYVDKMNSILGVINAKQFHYNPATDPMYKQVRDNYKKTAGDVIENTMGSYAGMTGGMPSSYAISAAAQAGAQHVQKADYMIPELYELAYNKFAQDKADLYKQYGIMQDLENQSYERDVYEEEKAYERDLYAQQQADAKAQAQAKAEADAEKALLDYEKWLSEYGLDLAQMESTEKKNALSAVMTMIENGSIPPDYMLESAGLEGISGQQLLDDYRNEGERILQSKSKYTNSSGVKETELKRPTSSMFYDIDELFEEGEGTDGLAKLKSKYDWSVYDEKAFDDYVRQHYGDEEGVSDFYKLNEADIFDEPDTTASYASKLADEINAMYMADSEESGYKPITKYADGTYRASGSTAMRVIDTILSDDNLTDDEAWQMLNLFGITHEQIKKYQENKNY